MINTLIDSWFFIYLFIGSFYAAYIAGNNDLDFSEALLVCSIIPFVWPWEGT